MASPVLNPEEMKRNDVFHLDPHAFNLLRYMTMFTSFERIIKLIDDPKGQREQTSSVLSSLSKIRGLMN